MGITNSNKEIDVSKIDCHGTVKVTLGLSAAPDISSNPTDIVLVLDRSGSMAGSPLANMKAGAKTFIDIIDESTDGAQDGNIGSGSHMGIVSFASIATADTGLITSTDTLKNVVDGLAAGGATNHADAFSKAIQLFDPASSNARVIVMFTDGKTTAGAPPAPVAAEATDASHVAVTPDEEELEDLFADLAADISKPGALDIVIDEMVNPDFTIVSIDPPSKGTAEMINATTLQWKISELGVSGNEGASLEFYIKHIGQTSGSEPVNASITYSDKNGNKVTFPEPYVTVDCEKPVEPEKCPKPVEFKIEGCKDFAEIDLGDVYLESLGRILELNLTIKNVCPDKRVALGIILTEVDCYGKEYQRGLKTMTIPAHHSSGCRDIQVKCIKFVLPEDLNVCRGNSGSMCGERKFKAQVIANTIDTDFKCCESAGNI